MTTTITLDDRQLAHVLAALRHTQWAGTSAEIYQQGHFDDVVPLDEDEVDALCEDINCSDAPRDSDIWREALVNLVEWAAEMGGWEAPAWLEARKALGYEVDEEEGRACYECAVKLDPGEGVEPDADEGLLCYDCHEGDTTDALPLAAEEEAEAKPNTRDHAALIARAREEYAAPSDNNIEVDDEADVSEPEGGYGAWVAAWVWLYDSHICQDCRAEHDEDEECSFDTDEGDTTP